MIPNCFCFHKNRRRAPPLPGMGRARGSKARRRGRDNAPTPSDKREHEGTNKPANLIDQRKTSAARQTAGAAREAVTPHGGRVARRNHQNFSRKNAMQMQQENPFQVYRPPLKDSGLIESLVRDRTPAEGGGGGAGTWAKTEEAAAHEPLGKCTEAVRLRRRTSPSALLQVETNERAVFCD
jgi:hypothetical protein